MVSIICEDFNIFIMTCWSRFVTVQCPWLQFYVEDFKPIYNGLLASSCHCLVSVVSIIPEEFNLSIITADLIISPFSARGFNSM